MGVGVFFPSGQLGISLTATFGSIIMTARPLGAIGLKGCLAVRSERERRRRKNSNMCVSLFSWRNGLKLGKMQFIEVALFASK